VAIEIERKFLVAHDDWRSGATDGVLYRQGYLSRHANRSVRVRIAGDRAWLTTKGIISDLSRHEFEYAIPVEDAEQMLEKMCIKSLIEKTRYLVFFAGCTWEVDEFSGENAGLVIAEIELDSEDQEVALPAWLGTEVTDDLRYRNVNLVKQPFSTWTR